MNNSAARLPRPTATNGAEDPSAALSGRPDEASEPRAGSSGRGLLRWTLPVLTATPVAAAAWFVTRFDPTDRVPDPTGPCLYHMVTGLNGPMCGGTRMFYYLLHADPVNAARHHLPALIAVPFLMYAWVGWVVTLFGVHLPPLRMSRRVLIAYGVFFVVFTTVLRNLGWGPLEYFDIPSLDV